MRLAVIDALLESKGWWAGRFAFALLLLATPGCSPTSEVAARAPADGEPLTCSILSFRDDLMNGMPEVPEIYLSRMACLAESLLQAAETEASPVPGGGFEWDSAAPEASRARIVVQPEDSGQRVDFEFSTAAPADWLELDDRNCTRVTLSAYVLEHEITALTALAQVEFHRNGPLQARMQVEPRLLCGGAYRITGTEAGWTPVCTTMVAGNTPTWSTGGEVEEPRTVTSLESSAVDVLAARIQSLLME